MAPLSFSTPHSEIFRLPSLPATVASFQAQRHLQSGALVQLLPDWSLPGGWLQAVYPHRRGVMPAVRAWIEHLAESFNSCGDRLI